MVAEAGIGAKSALYAAEQSDHLFAVSAAEVIGDVIAGEQDDIDFKLIETFDATTKIVGGDGPAVMKVAYVGNAGAVQSAMAFSQLEVYINNFKPFASVSFDIDCRAGTEAQSAEGGTFEEVASVDKVFACWSLP